MIGTKLSHFEITAKIGEGGMGEVYQATDTRLNREVALKVLPETFSQNAERMARFSREAQLLASLNHPNIASIHGLEETNGTRALVMELVQGEDLAERISRGPIPLEEGLPIALQITEALEDAHEKGIIHRDLKPANVRITPEGKVKILDFGLAKALEEERTPQDLSNSPTLTAAATQAGYILGTAAYMSPEQARGKPVDQRADIWAFGIVLFEMLAGRQVFHAGDISFTLASVMKDEPDWGMLPSETPSSIKQLLKRCLRKDVRRRIQHIGDARIGVEDYLANPHDEEPDPAESPAPAMGRGRKLVFGLGSLLVVALVVLLSWLAKPEPPAAGPLRLSVDVSGNKALGVNSGNSAALSPDGRLLAYQTSVVADRLRLRSLDRLTSEVLPGTETATAPFFSPDGRWIGFTTRLSQELNKVSVSGGTPITLCSVSSEDSAPNYNVNAGGTWGPNGIIVFGVPGGSLMKVSASGGTPEKLTELEDGELGHAWPQFLPGGEQVLFSSFRSETSRIEAVELESKRRTVVLDTGGEYPRYAASGHLLYVNNGTLYAASFDTNTLQTRSEPLPVLEDVLMDSVGSGAAQYGVSENGTLFYLGGEANDGYNPIWVNAEGTQTPASKMLPNYSGYFDLSPDGRRLAVGMVSDRNVDVWVIDLEAESQLRLTSDKAVDQHPIWSPDGRFLYFTSSRGGRSGIYRKAADGSGKTESIWEGEAIVVVRAASEKYLILAIDFEIYLLSLLEKGPTEPEPYLANVSYDAGSPRISPDGKWLAYDSNETGRWEVFVGSFPQAGARWQVSSEGGFRPHWSANGKRLFYRTDDAIWASEVKTRNDSLQLSKPERLAELEGWYDQDLGVDFNGDRFLLINEGGQGAGRNHVTFVFNWFEELKQLTETQQ